MTKIKSQTNKNQKWQLDSQHKNKKNIAVSQYPTTISNPVTCLPPQKKKQKTKKRNLPQGSGQVAPMWELATKDVSS